MLGGTIGMALCGGLLAATGDYRIVYLATGAQTFLVLLIASLTIERR